MDTTSIQTLHTVVVDSVEYIHRTDVLEFYSDLVDKQANQFTILLTALGIAFGSWLVGTWVWNIWGAKRQIKDEVAKKVEEAKQELAQSLQNFIDNKANEIKETVQEKQNDFEQKQNELFKDFRTGAELRFDNLAISIFCITAIHCYSVKDYYNTITWTMSAIERSKKIHEDKKLGVYINQVYTLLKKHDIVDVDNRKDSWIKIIQDCVPLVMEQKKEEIIELLQNLPTEKNNKNE